MGLRRGRQYEYSHRYVCLYACTYVCTYVRTYVRMYVCIGYVHLVCAKHHWGKVWASGLRFVVLGFLSFRVEVLGAPINSTLPTGELD